MVATPISDIYAILYNAFCPARIAESGVVPARSLIDAAMMSTPYVGKRN